MKTIPALIAAGLLLAAVACNDDSGPARDGAVGPDVNASDAAVDTSPGPDAATPDAASPDAALPDSAGGDTGSGSFKISSTAFKHNQAIPAKYTCQGSDLSPALAWTGAPTGTKAFALICDDPDAPSGTFTHWLIYDMPATLTGLGEGVAAGATVSGVGKQGVNDFGKTQYNGPCPPAGKVHHYNFTLYALSAQTGLAGGTTLSQLTAKLSTLSLGKTVVIGTYSR
jgi:Raf kinase inhibitor-like YbhB/YbcL family protein